jgi:hypothetical protein
LIVQADRALHATHEQMILVPSSRGKRLPEEDVEFVSHVHL